MRLKTFPAARDRRRSATAVATLLCGLVALSGCGSTQGDDVNDGDTTQAISPAPSDQSMESAIADMQKMRAEIATSLRRTYGPPAWGLASNEEALIRRAFCGNTGEEIATLPSWATRGTYDSSQWKSAASAVERIGRKYGFEQTSVIVDRPEDFEIAGKADDGAEYTFGFAANGVLGIKTGCHQWEEQPTGEIPDSASS